MKPSTESLLFAIELVNKAVCEKRSDLPGDVILDLLDIRSRIQYLKECECE